ncbi:hypothetical protein PHJA_002200700 [Phtheirospermum japonicum]|uniref:Uncharacterized protein n=1 Tax=Phtheirospermum japonicum TaxID=374723 RepID=A0A830CIQ6_9LAMI|nr:hypothetical protein PHJA_002200700 [Phtheirospermum japonicum]
MVKEEKDEISFPTLKFPFLPLPAGNMHSPDHPSDHPSPPLQTLASVPFKWEEQPGKPRPCTDIIPLPGPGPMVLLDPCSKITKMPSPTAVLDGPYTVARPKFSSFRFLRESFDSSSSESPYYSSLDVLLGNRNGGGQKGRRGFFGRFKGGKKEVDEGSFGFSSPSSTTGDERRMRRNGSFSSRSQPTSPRLCVSYKLFHSFFKTFSYLFLFFNFFF